MPTARYFVNLAAGTNGKLYAIGGVDTGSSPYPCTGLVEEYDPVADTWATKSSMLTARCNFSVTTAANGKIYAAGGNPHSSSGVSKTMEEYDPGTDAWTPRAAMTVARGSFALVAANGRVYAIGGFPITQSVERYDPGTDTWGSDTAIPGVREAHGGALGVNGKIYVTGGDDGAGLFLPTTVEATVP